MDASDQQGADLPPGAAASAPRLTKRTRFVCISDTHNSTVKLPKGDVLIHAGDLTNQGSYSEVPMQPSTMSLAKRLIPGTGSYLRPSSG